MDGTTRLPALSERLACAASFVREGAFIADVGTDHAYLPIWLTLKGRISGALATDVVKGPLEKARQNIARYGVQDRISLLLADGLNGAEAYRPADILICGMGGELIASILAASDYVRSPDVRLILQPMSMADRLRSWLSENGFGIDGEMLSRETGGRGRIYQVIVCSYTGVSCDLTPAEALLGPVNVRRGGETFRLFAQRAADRLEKQIRGMKKAGLDASAQESLRREVLLLGEEGKTL